MSGCETLRHAVVCGKQGCVCVCVVMCLCSHTGRLPVSINLYTTEGHTEAHQRLTVCVRVSVLPPSRHVLHLTLVIAVMVLMVLMVSARRHTSSRARSLYEIQ